MLDDTHTDLDDMKLRVQCLDIAERAAAAKITQDKLDVIPDELKNPGGKSRVMNASAIDHASKT